ncbi:hypothetical protein VR7_gp232 [Escherichia phage vB_EcoM_VR7]|uniref:Uncharacterized protein VR7ORF232c n=1 Tax=Escherichia phage vB_EcoM_VR7 TaxID=700939 RepID=E5FIZ6_9CAUD|nr:hypothetical protein VR7_gp232 [Escherichia phage vB_EcoM_VR7]ADR32607.1 hypothetical protein VR7_gp232 [Escherichia phage vB_EcoM_VR7]
MSDFFEEGKFYKFTSENAKKQFIAGGWAANYQIAGYIGMTPFEVKIVPDTISGGRKVCEIRLIDENDFVDLAKISSTQNRHHGALFVSAGPLSDEFDYFIQAEVGVKPEVEPVPVKLASVWKLLVVKNGKIEINSRHVSKEYAEDEAERLLNRGTAEDCYIIKGDITKASIVKQVKQETI